MGGVTVLYQDKETRSEGAEADGDALWLTLPELTAATGWELKPEGVCKGEICVPVPNARRTAMLVTKASRTWFNLTEFARLIEQPFAHDQVNSVWYFGPPGWEWKARLGTRQAPDFALPDLTGRLHALSDLRGKKIFLLFWASW